MSTDDVVARAMKIALLLGLLSAVVACSDSVALVLVGPTELNGAAILIDGKERARFRRIAAQTDGKMTGVLAEIQVPLGRHLLEVRHPDFPTISQELTYGKRGEDYVSVELPH